MKSAIKSASTTYGLVIGLIAIAYTLYAYLFDLQLMANMWGGLLLWLISFIIMILAVANAKKSLGGYISFKDAFSTFMLTYLIYAVVSTLFTVLLFQVIDPDAAEVMQEYIMQAAYDNMKRFGAPESQIDAAMADMEGQNQFSLASIGKSLIFGIILYAVLGLIVAAIMKKKNPDSI